jgi:enoyl-[acyl-carrier protein] reductase III
MSGGGSDGTLGLEGRAAVVTGATRGLGLAIARKLCGCGVDVVLDYRADDGAAEAAVDSLAGLKGRAVAVRQDVRRPDAVAVLLGEARQRFGRVDVLVHNASAFSPVPTREASVHALRRDLTTALNPLLAGAPALAELLPAGGRVIAVSSSGTDRVVPGYLSQGLAKAALETLVRYLALDLGEQGVAVNAVSTAKLHKGEGPAPRLGARQLTRPEQVADAVALLCTDEADWIRGQVLTVDGGWNLQP